MTSPTNLSELSVQIVSISTVLAFLILVFRLCPELNEVMYPYYKEKDVEKAGFISFKDALRTLPIYRSTAYYRLLMPLFGTSYLFIVLVFDYYFYPYLVNDQKYIYYMTALWGLCLFQSGSIVPMLGFSVVPFVIGFLISDSLFGGYVATVIVLTLFYAYSFEDNYVLKLFINKIEIKSGKTLTGNKLSILRRLFGYVRFGLLLSTPALMVYTLIRIIVKSDVSTSTFNLKYVDSTVESLVLGLPLILVYANISIMAFGGIFKYLQVDFFTELGKRILFKVEDPQGFKKQEDAISEQIKGRKANRVLPVRPTDRILPLDISSIRNFRVALTFFSLDGLLTAASVLGIKFIPGVEIQNIHTLSSLLKIPVYIIFIIRSVNRLQVWLMAKGYGCDSETYKEEIDGELQYYSSIEQLIKSIQKQQIGKNEYFNVSGNKYLLSLAGYTEGAKRTYI